MDIIVYLNIFAFGWICCNTYIVWKLRRALKKIAEDNGMTFEELATEFFESKDLKTNVINVPYYFTEVSGNSILLYNKETGNFTGQAYTVAELAENLYKYDRIKFALVSHKDNQFWFVEGKVKIEVKEI